MVRFHEPFVLAASVSLPFGERVNSNVPLRIVYDTCANVAQIPNNKRRIIWVDRAIKDASKLIRIRISQYIQKTAIAKRNIAIFLDKSLLAEQAPLDIFAWKR
jgi:hypothetical protein